MLCRTLWLIDENDSTRSAKLEINPWTGLPRVERIDVSAREMEDESARGDAEAEDEDFAFEDEIDADRAHDADAGDQP